jgi:hypothetical protein
MGFLSRLNAGRSRYCGGLIARPRPVPPYFRAVDASAWENSWNSLPICSRVMPTPVSIVCSIALSRSVSVFATFWRAAREMRFEERLAFGSVRQSWLGSPATMIELGLYSLRTTLRLCSAIFSIVLFIRCSRQAPPGPGSVPRILWLCHLWGNKVFADRRPSARRYSVLPIFLCIATKRISCRHRVGMAR